MVVQAARRKAITELIFFAGINDARRCSEMAALWGINVCTHPPVNLSTAFLYGYAHMLPHVQQQQPHTSNVDSLLTWQVSDHSCIDYDKRMPM
jgi:L-alanine-DL-glutamate epimerase-like enolase superfamily enzyme